MHSVISCAHYFDVLCVTITMQSYFCMVPKSATISFMSSRHILILFASFFIQSRAIFFKEVHALLYILLRDRPPVAAAKYTLVWADLNY